MGTQSPTSKTLSPKPCAGAAIVASDVTIVDTGGADVSDVIAKATITLVNHQPNDLLSVTGSLPAGVTALGYNPATGVLTLTGSGTSTAAGFPDRAAGDLVQQPRRQSFYGRPHHHHHRQRRHNRQQHRDRDGSRHCRQQDPALDLDAGGVAGPATILRPIIPANGAAVAIANTSVSLTDADNTTLASATAVLTNAKAGDILSISGALPAEITAVTTTGPGTTITVTLTGAATLADYQNALKQFRFSKSARPPPDQTGRDVPCAAVQRRHRASNVAHTTITMHPVNHPPVAQNSERQRQRGQCDLRQRGRDRRRRQQPDL